MARKSFFRERTTNQIARLQRTSAFSPRNLVRRIEDLHPDDALIIRVGLIPGKFYTKKGGGRVTGKEATRKAYKHGALIALPNPRTQRECYESPRIPLDLRAEAFEQLSQIREEENFFMGYSTQTTFGDRRKRVFPFVNLAEGERIFAFAESQTPEGIKVEIYENAKRVRKEGATVAVEVPSREQKHSRYKFKLLHVPIVRGRENLASVLQLKPALETDEETGEPGGSRPLHETYDIRYTSERDPESSEIIRFLPQDFAAYLAVVKASLKDHNLTPMEMNPFSLLSKRGAEFYKKTRNNVLVYDPTIERKDHLRKLHLAEECILLSREIGVAGHDAIAYWDPSRDGKIADYDWSISGKQ